MIVRRGNSEAVIEGAPQSLLDLVARRLSVEVDPTQPRGKRFGSVYQHHGRAYGSLLRGAVVPAGLAGHVVSVARASGVPCEMLDERVRPEPRPWNLLRPPADGWRGYQDSVHEAVLACGGVCIVDAPPRSGKTLMGARFVDAVGLPTLWIAPSVSIVGQTFRLLRSVFGSGAVSRVDGEVPEVERDLSRDIVVATAASAARLPPEWYATRGCMLIDEFHHWATDMFYAINDLARGIYYRLCMTGTHFRTGDDGLALEGVCSQVAARVPVGDLVARGYLAEPRVTYAPLYTKPCGGDWKTAYQRGIVDSRDRNDLAAWIARSLVAAGVPTIVLVKRRKHADVLASMIPGAQVAKGGQNALTSRTVSDFNAGRIDAIVGTTVIGEGVDLPRAGALVYASGGSDGVTMLQSYFRPLTAHPGKSVGRIWDFRDSHNKTLHRHYQERAAFARKHLGESSVVVDPRQTRMAM